MPAADPIDSTIGSTIDMPESSSPAAPSQGPDSGTAASSSVEATTSDPAAPSPTTSAVPVDSAVTETDDLSDEFDADLDEARWAVVERIGDTSNAEEQCYLRSNVSVGDGALHITTRPDQSGCAAIGADVGYSSGMVQWRTGSFTYGRLEVRARVGGGRGPWPAIWLLGTNCQPNNPVDANDFDCNWPEPGADEIDMVEYLGGDFRTLNQQIHTVEASPQCLSTVDDPIGEWHIYGMDWTPGRIAFDVDGVVTCELDQAVPDTPKFLIINTAVGGFGGGAVDPSTMPVDMYVDWVRVEPAAS